MARKVEEDFTCTPRFSLQRFPYKIRILLALVFLSIGCEPQIDDQIPYVLVEIDINLNNADFFDLQHDGGFVYVLGGVKGIIIFRQSGSDYRAFERASPVDPLAGCSVVDVHSSGLYMVDPCHNVLFDFDGQPISGNSLPMRQYFVTLDQNWLYIRSE